MNALLKILGNVGGSVVAPVADYFKRKAELAHEKHQARVQNIRQGKIAEADWNSRAAAMNDWRDDYLTVVLSMPMILAFFPPMVPYLHAGFAVLQEMPEWYKGAVAVMIASAFAYRKYVDAQLRKAYTLPAQLPDIKVTEK